MNISRAGLLGVRFAKRSMWSCTQCRKKQGAIVSNKRDTIMITQPIGRRMAVWSAIATAIVAASSRRDARAEEKSITISVNLSFTGADAESATRIHSGALMAFDEANAKGGVNGYKIVVTPYDDGTATAGQYDPAQAATNARRMVSNRSTLAAIGPQMSGAGKAMAPILSQGDLAIVTPTTTNPDITDPKFAQIYRPQGPAIYFRTVSTDAFQGPNMANYYADVLKVPHHGSATSIRPPIAHGSRSRESGPRR